VRLLATIRVDAHRAAVRVHGDSAGRVGTLKQNLVLAAQNDVLAHEFGATTSALTFFP
jgi:hypothetical protein